MAITVTWTFPDVDVEPDVNNVDSDVISIEWHCTALDEDTGETFEMNGEAPCDPPVMFGTLTFESASAIVFSTVDQVEVETEVTNVLTAKLAQKPVTIDPTNF